MNFYRILSGWLWCHVSQVTGLLDILTTAFSSPPTENDAGRLWLRVCFFFHLDVLVQCTLPLMYQLFIFLPVGADIVITNICFFIDESCFSLKFRHLRPLLWHLQIFCAQFSGQLVTLYLPGKSASLSYMSSFDREHHTKISSQYGIRCWRYSILMLFGCEQQTFTTSSSTSYKNVASRLWAPTSMPTAPFVTMRSMLTNIYLSMYLSIDCFCFCFCFGI